MLRWGALEIEAVGVWMLKWDALETEAVGAYMFGCSDGVHSNLRLLEFIFFGSQMGCTRN